SGRLYLRIGFRETSMIGAALLFIACIWFLLLPRPQPIYLIVLIQILMGAGFGLLSTPSMVGIQAMVPWQQRGMVTSANVFSRNLGQSLGATLVGAIFNNSILQQLKDAPSDLTSATKNVMEILHNPAVSDEAKEYLRGAINLAMSHVYWGLAFFTIIIFICLYRVPSRDPNEEIIELEIE